MTQTFKIPLIFLHPHYPGLETVCKLTVPGSSLSCAGSVALQSSHGGRSQLLHRGPRSCRYAAPGDRKGPVRTHPRSQGAHHGAGAYHSGDRALQSGCIQQGQTSDGLLRPQKVSHGLSRSCFSSFWFNSVSAFEYSCGFEFQATLSN